MANVFLNVNTDALIVLSNRLEKIRKIELPIAVRGTLNKAAFDVKQVTMPITSGERFEKRKPNFFKANSRVEMAQGLDLRTMKSVVGFVTQNAQYNHEAVLELHQQEHGGRIGNRTFIPTDVARTGSSNATPVRPRNRLSSIGKNIEERAIHAKKQLGPNRRFKFIKAAIKAGRGGYVIAGLRKTMLYRIESTSRKFGRTFVKQTPLYSYEKGRSVGIKSTGFMREATNVSAKKLNKFFIAEANRRFAKMLKK